MTESAAAKEARLAKAEAARAESAKTEDSNGTTPETVTMTKAEYETLINALTKETISDQKSGVDIDASPSHNYKTAREYEEAREIARLAEKVSIRLPKDNDNYKDDVSVCINGVIWQIKRGVDVMVPRSVAETLKQSQDQMLLADIRMAEAANMNLGER